MGNYICEKLRLRVKNYGIGRKEYKTHFFVSLFLCFCLLLTLAFPAYINAVSSPDVVISKIAAFEKSGYEWIEIANRSNQAVDVAGWKFWEDKTNHKMELAQGSDLIFDSGERAVVVQDKDKFLEEYVDYTGTIIDSAWSSLKETGEEIGLKNANLEAVEVFTYIECPDNVLERVDVNSDDYSQLNWHERINTDEERIETDHGSDTPQVPATQGNGGSVISENPFPIRENPSVNHAPAAVLGDDLEINLGEAVFFDGSDSFDEDKDNLEYSWNFGDGEEGEGVKLEHIYFHSGKFSVILSVYDGKITSTDAMWVNVKKVEYPKNIFINAILPNPAGSDLENEWIEVCSLEEENVNFDKWMLDDEEGGSKEYKIEEVEIKPKECLKFFRQETKISLNNNSDSARLFNPNKEIASELDYNVKSVKDNEIIYNKQGGEIEKQRNKEIEKQEAGQGAADKKIVSSGEYTESKNNASSGNSEVKAAANKNNSAVKAAAVKVEEILGGSYEGKTVKIEGKIADKSGNVFFVDDSSGIIKISIPSKILKANYAKIKVGGNIAVSGIASKLLGGYKMLANGIAAK